MESTNNNNHFIQIKQHDGDVVYVNARFIYKLKVTPENMTIILMSYGSNIYTDESAETIIEKIIN